MISITIGMIDVMIDVMIGVAGEGGEVMEVGAAARSGIAEDILDKGLGEVVITVVVVDTEEDMAVVVITVVEDTEEVMVGRSIGDTEFGYLMTESLMVMDDFGYGMTVTKFHEYT